ncbi:MAG: non-heme iron oxygenase ferredoxin subunit [Chloroflexi bacterium]|nr:non-heme iron oxygenase ferredoxin subunit [Chloroflexota bacterium]
MAYVKLCRTDAVPPGELRQFNAGGEEILVANLEGKYSCLAARCTHAGAPLAEGEMDGNVLVCPWHGSRFGVGDGSVLLGPAQKPLKVYAAEVRDGYVWIDL